MVENLLYTNGDDIAGTENQLVDFQKIMKELQTAGLTVLRWDSGERSFKRACIKVDEKLQGLFILDQDQKLVKELSIRDLNRVAHDAEADPENRLRDALRLHFRGAFLPQARVPAAGPAKTPALPRNGIR